MAQYAIAFDLDSRAAITAGLTRADLARIYGTELPNALAQCGFTVHLQGSVYTTGGDRDPLKAIVQLQAALSNAPNFCKFVKRLHIFRIEEWTDITPVVAGKTAAPMAAMACTDDDLEALLNVQ